jgi:nitrate/TMAO reductase-like tetraheme cytochrome c subunit
LRISRLLSRRSIVVGGGVVAVALVGLVFAYEPVTRNVMATDSVCSYCHLEREYLPTARLSFSKPHPAAPKEGEEEAQCVDCHLPKGFWATTFAYTHFVSITDLFGHFRDRASERAGDWIPPSAARAYRTRDRLFEYDSVTCRTCHIESEIKPKRKRGQRAHARALENKETCIECHDNLVHRYVELRETAFQKPDTAAK